MARGGPRSGAGRKKGQATKMNEAARKAALAQGISPLDFPLNAMRDDQQPFDKRLDAAKAAAPYVHARLSSVEQTGKDGGPIQTVHRVERVICDPASPED